MTRFIDAHRATFGVEPICRVLAVAPSSYYAARGRPPSARTVRDIELGAVIRRIHAANFGVYGVRKMWAALAREGIPTGRDRIARIMREEGLAGVRRERRTTTTRPAPARPSTADLVDRDFAAPAPDRLWVADITYVARAPGGFCYTAFVTDVFARRIVGWRVAGSLGADLALDALEMALDARGGRLPGLVHHSDRGIQGGFHRSSQHLDMEVLQWAFASGGWQSRRGAVRSGRLAGHRSHGVETASGSGGRSPGALQRRTPPPRQGSRHPSDRAGSVRLAGCRPCRSSRSPLAT